MSVFIPKPYKKDPITVRVDGRKLDMIDQLAGQYEISRSALINQCIDYALEHMPSLTEKR